jgi:hypothetical protein
MVALFDYYGLMVFFKKNISIPISVYAKRGERESCMEIVFQNGLVKSITPVQQDNELDKEDNELFKLLIEKNISEIIKFWLDAFLYDKEVPMEVITGKLQESAS